MQRPDDASRVRRGTQRQTSRETTTTTTTTTKSYVTLHADSRRDEQRQDDHDQLETLSPPRFTTIRLANRVPHTGYRFVHRRPRIKRERRGSGPFQSVLKERAVEFNLTLDVQNLRHEIQQLTTTRELLQSRVLHQRDSPSGSLMQIVQEFYRLFRQGFRVEEQPQRSRRRRRVITAGVQRDFLQSVVHDAIDFEHGLRGVAFMVEMIRRYSLLLRFICLKMDSVEIVSTDESVLIVATGSIRFQVLRETIVGLFPHIVGDETLCARLIGADVEAANVVSFCFDASSRIWRYAFDVDYVACFSRLLGDLRSVARLLERSRIGDKSMFGVTKDGHIENVDQLDETTPPPAASSSEEPLFEIML